MPKQLIIEPCIINHGDDRGGVDHAAGEIVDVPRDAAYTLAQAGRALYVDKKDDPDKSGRNTASADMLKAAADLAAAQAKAAKEKAAA